MKDVKNRSIRFASRAKQDTTVTVLVVGHGILQAICFDFDARGFTNLSSNFVVSKLSIPIILKMESTRKHVSYPIEPCIIYYKYKIRVPCQFYKDTRNIFFPNYQNLAPTIVVFNEVTLG